MEDMINVVELCPHCGYENEYNVSKDVWIMTCSDCGKPIVLCDKCLTMNGCNNQHCIDCVHDRKCKVFESVFDTVNKEVK